MRLLMIAISFKAAVAAAQAGGAAGPFGYLALGIYHPDATNGLQWSTNPAALSHYQATTASVYGEKRFLLNDLSLVQVGAAFPVGDGGFGLLMQSFGSAAFNQNKLGFAYGRSLGDRAAMGVQFNYHYYHIAGYGSAGAATVEAGLMYRLAPNIQAGVQVVNPTQSGFFRFKEERLPTVVSAGLGYSPSPALHLSSTVVKEWNRPLDVQTGLQYNLGSKVLVKGGVATAAGAYFVAAGFALLPLQFEIVASFHPQMGVSPGIMLTFKNGAE